MEIMEKEGFMLSVFTVTEVLSPKLYQNITGPSLSPVLFPVSLGLQWCQQRGVKLWTSMHPALLTHRSVINPKPCSLPQLTAPTTSWDARKRDKQETSIALGGQQHKNRKMCLGWKFMPCNH